MGLSFHRKKAAEALREKIAVLPTSPGVYTYYDAAGTVIYVGKAKNLKRRVSSYFNRDHDVKRTNLLVAAIADMSYIVVPTEQDALNLEASMIKEHQPRFNVLLKDDKSYPWIVVTNEDFPRVFMTRTKEARGGRYYGPYSNTQVAHTVLDHLRELFPLRSCRGPLTAESVAQGKGRLCLDFHIHRCEGACCGLVDKETYGKHIEAVRHILNGDTSLLLDHLRSEMERLSAALRFEEAQELKERYKLIERYQARSVIVSPTLGELDVFGIDDGSSDACEVDPARRNEVWVNYMRMRNGAVVKSLTLRFKRRLDEPTATILSLAMAEVAAQLGVTYKEVVVGELPDFEPEPGVTFTVPRRGDKAKLLALSVKNARQQRRDSVMRLERKDPAERVNRLMRRMMEDFRLSEEPRHIECFDNSNIQGTNPVASCVVFRDGKPAKNDYRHFNIKTVEGPDDFASMKEVLTRRYTRLVAEGRDLPQLVIVDGGKGQLSAAVEAFEAMGLRGKVALAGIAKRLEEIYFPGDSVPLYIDKNSDTLRVVQHLRDEAHRFGITHHRNRRSKAQTVSALDSIKGIGPASRTALLKHFRSMKRVAEATADELAEVVGPSRAALLFAALHPSDE